MNMEHTAESLRTDGGESRPGVPDPDDESDETDDSTSTGDGRTMPGVPESNRSPSSPEHSTGTSQTTGGTPERTERARSGGDTDGLTTVFTFEAVTSLADPSAVLEDVRSWSEWVGVVGEVDEPTMHTFLRRNDLSVDFFSGPSGPVDRLRRIDQTDSSFGSAREVLIGLDEQDHIAEEANWEFQSLESVAEEADWDLQ